MSDLWSVKRRRLFVLFVWFVRVPPSTLDNDEDDDRPAVDFLGPGLCNSLDTSAKFWRSKGHWETQEFTDAVEGIARHGRWHCQLQLTMMSRRLRDALVRDIRNGRVAYVLYLRARMHAKHVFARAPLFG